MASDDIRAELVRVKACIDEVLTDETYTVTLSALALLPTDDLPVHVEAPLPTLEDVNYMLAVGGGDDGSDDDEEEEEETSEDHDYDREEEEATVVVEMGLTEKLDSVQHTAKNTGGAGGACGAGGAGVGNTDGDDTSEDETSSQSSSLEDDEMVVQVVGAVEESDNIRDDTMKAYLLSMFGPNDSNDNRESQSAEVVRDAKTDGKDKEARKDEDIGGQEEEKQTVKLQEENSDVKEQNEEVEEIAIIVEARRTLPAREEQQR
jgi:hypothetical protein